MFISIIGYSGHSYICIEAIQNSNFNLEGYYDDEEKLFNPYNLSFLGNENETLKGKNLFISIGNNEIRERLYYKHLNKNNLNINLIHLKSIVSESVSFGFGNLVSAGAIINPLVKIGNGVIINTGAVVEHECEIGDFSHIAPGSVLAGKVKIGKKCFVGANSVIKNGVTIGDNTIIGAGSVVINDIESNFTYIGNPARKLIKK